jgi:4-amino-4-deoxy-L-arabinose transferase-like glycosyltransferase
MIRATTPRREFLLVALLGLLWLGFTAGLRPLMLPDEGRYVGVAWEMLRSGDWLTPMLNGQPFFHKPPLFYWITAGALGLFGQHEWAARAAPLLGAWAAACALFWTLRRWSSPAMAWAAWTALLVQPLFFVGAQFANLDMLVAGCIASALLLGADAALSFEAGRPWRRVLLLAYLAAALGVLAKGLIGLVLPGLPLLLWLALRRRWTTLRTLFWLPGLLLLAALTVPWFLAEEARYPGFLHFFFVVQHFQRFAGAGFNNVQPFWFYAALLALLSLPWLPWLSRLVRRSVWREGGAGDLRWLMLIWLGVVLLFFSLPRSKLVGYIFPLLPALAALMADAWLLGAQRSALQRRAWQWVSAGAALTSVAAVVALTLYPQRNARELAQLLREQHRAGEPVLMLGRYDYDLPFYARLPEPVWVADDWESPEVMARDNWRKELAEARFFLPAERAAAHLPTPDQLGPLLCAAPTSWVLADRALTRQYAWLARAELMRQQGDAGLWRLNPAEPEQAAALGCPAQALQTRQTPSSAPAQSSAPPRPAAPARG